MNVTDLHGKLNVRVRLEIPTSEKFKCKRPSVHGEHFAYDGADGVILAPGGNGSALVCFGDTISKYVGCPLEWLTVISNEHGNGGE